MPQRLIKPRWWWQKISAPITLKGLLLAMAVGFIAYIVVRDESQRRASFERYKAISAYTEQSRVALEGAKMQNEIIDQSHQDTIKLINFMDELNKSMKDVADILRINRAAQYTEHEMLLKRNTAQASKKKASKPTEALCYERQPVEKQFGNTSVLTHIYTKIPCN